MTDESNKLAQGGSENQRQSQRDRLAWAAALLIGLVVGVAGLAGEYAGVLLAIATALTIQVIGWYLDWRFQGYVHAAALFIIGAIGGITVGHLGWLSAPALRITMETTFIGVADSDLEAKKGSFGLWAGGAENEKPFVEPIHRLIYFSITNVQKQTTEIESLMLEDHGTDGSWKRLCSVSLVSRALLRIRDWKNPNVVDRVSNSNALDVLAFGKKLEPNATVGGWTAWQCAGRCAPISGLRLRVKERSGASTTQEIELADDDGFEGSPTFMDVEITGTNIAGMPVRLEPACQ